VDLSRPGAGDHVHHIERLPDDLVNKIAAGEVVERPASVVKELVENALDAAAATVTVDLAAGGKELVRVRDDGHGMGAEDARRALERHATSKLRELADLERMTTHGFRGEALPSIASVSHLVLRTCEAGASGGTEVEVRHGRLVHVRDTGHPRGTTVEVRDLFGAVPARRKFLRAEPTEAAHVAEALTLLALARPDVGFFLTSSGRSTIQAPAVDGLFARVHQVFGATYADELVAIESGQAWVRVRGFARAPTAAPSRTVIRLFVNGRAVRDRAIARAVTEAYRATGVRDPRAEVLLFVEVPLHMVDVNVHPAKTEVRFAEPRTVWSAVEHALRQALSTGGGNQHVPRVVLAGEAGATSSAARGWGTGSTSGASMVREAASGTLHAEAVQDPGAVHDRLAPALLETAPPTVLGQHRNTYIVATDGDDLILVDQHTAHERVRFEAILEGLERRAVESQLLLVPMVVMLPPRLRPGLEANQPALRALGFDAEPFGGDSVRVSAVPAVLGGRDPGASLAAILSDLLDRESAQWAVSSARDRLAATVACHSAARGGDPLTADAMRAIVAGLWSARDPTTCPHGRPTRVRVAREDVSRWFRRTGWTRE
jgi:DNA mismatch repair protein MutL